MRGDLVGANDELSRALAEFSRAALRLSIALDHASRDVNEAYPFTKPFELVATEIMTWADTHSEGCDG